MFETKAAHTDRRAAPDKSVRPAFDEALILNPQLRQHGPERFDDGTGFKHAVIRWRQGHKAPAAFCTRHQLAPLFAGQFVRR